MDLNGGDTVSVIEVVPIIEVIGARASWCVLCVVRGVPPVDLESEEEGMCD